MNLIEILDNVVLAVQPLVAVVAGTKFEKMNLTIGEKLTKIIESYI